MAGDYQQNPSPYSSPYPPARLPTGQPDSEIVEVEEIPPQRRGSLTFAIIAWLMILAIAIFNFVEPYIFPREPTGSSVKFGLAAMELQGKYLLGANAFSPDANLGTAEQTDPMNIGPVENRFCYAIMVNELQDADEASTRLGELRELIDEQAYELSDEQADVQNTLEKLFDDYQREAWEAPSVNQSERDNLSEHLGWFGKLALNVENSPDQLARQKIISNSKAVAIGTIFVVLLALMIAFCGFAGFFIFVVLAALGKLNFRTENYSGNGRIYVETFAVWFVLFFITGIGLGLFVALTGSSLEVALVLQFLLFIGSLVALCWPGIRGVPWAETAKDLGFKCKNILVEMFWGVVGYISGLPILVGGFIVTGVLIANFGPGEQPDKLDPEPVSHPVMDYIANGGVFALILVALTTVIAAPLVEETVFRGMMYRHFRDASGRWGRILSTLFAATLNSLIFAAIHPQGVFAIPVLASLAFAFSLVREWRGSLYAPMTMHAMHNGTIMVITLFLIL